MQKGSVLFLRLVVIVIGLAVLALCVLVLPKAAINIYDSPTFVQLVLYPIIIGMYLAAIPFYIALFQVLKLLKYIIDGKAFSAKAVQALKNVRWCALAISGVYTLIMPLIYIFGEKDDAPGVILIGLVIIFASFVIAVFASLLQKLLRNVIKIKTENDLTI